jgi:hypothetical protein
MFTPGQCRGKAVGYGDLVKAANGPEERREFQRSFTDNEQWLADNPDKTVRNREFEQTDAAALAQDEEQILRFLGAALILQWNTLPQKLRRELFDNAGAIGELLETGGLRGKIDRFLHKHKD